VSAARRSGKLTRPAPLGSRELLARMLEHPSLVAAVQSLPAPALTRLIGHVGLEDAGEIVALATTEQLRGVFDDDLWRSARPGEDEAFDAERFSLWLEVLLEAGEEVAARRLVELPEDLVTLGLLKQVLVVDIEEMAVAATSRRSDDDAGLEKALESCLCEDLDQYRIIARRHEGWDAVLGVLLALDRDHHEYLARLLDRCCAASADFIEENGGLYEVLTSEETLEADAAAEREDRRAEEGYLSPSSAASFLALARATPLEEHLASKDRDPIARAYFRCLRRPPGDPVARAKAGPAATHDTSRLVELLAEAEVLPRAQAVALLEAPHAEAAPGSPETLTLAMSRLRERSPMEHGRRMEEMAFVANALQAGASLEGRALRPAEAARVAAAACNLGLEHLVHTERETTTTALAGGADRLFRMAWRLLFQEVVLPAARELETMLAGATAARRGPDQTLARAAAVLHAAIAAGKPWSAWRRLRDVADGGRMVALLALGDECPHLDGELRPPPGAAGRELVLIGTQRQLAVVPAFLGGARRRAP